jgi:hypothetical protein
MEIVLCDMFDSNEVDVAHVVARVGRRSSRIREHQLQVQQAFDSKREKGQHGGCEPSTGESHYGASITIRAEYRLDHRFPFTQELVQGIALPSPFAELEKGIRVVNLELAPNVWFERMESVI